MDDIRDTRPWFWILTFVLFAIAVAALIIAISANNSSVDEKKIVKEATAQIEEELSGLHGALEAANEFSEENDELAKQDRIRIKREVNAAIEGGNSELNKVRRRVGALEGSTATLEKTDKELRGDVDDNTNSVNALGEDIEQLEREVAALNRKYKQLTGE